MIKMTFRNVVLQLLLAVLCWANQPVDDANQTWADQPGKGYLSKVFEDYQIVPDLVFTAPDNEIKASYGLKSVNLGNEFLTKDVQTVPDVYWDVDDEDRYYTLFILDPDAPTAKNSFLRSLVHYMVGNIRGNDVTSGIVYSKYHGPAPNKCSGYHRYVFLVYKQPCYLEYETRTMENLGIFKFNLENFSKAYGLGVPVAGNFYVAQYNDCNQYAKYFFQSMEKCSLHHYFDDN